MRELLETIVKGIVNNPDQVSIDERESVDFPGLTILEITVADVDKGVLIGRRGRTINAIRDLMTISAIRHDKKIKVLVKDDRAPESRDSIESAPKREEQHTEQAQHIEENNVVNEEPDVQLSDETKDLLDDDF